MRRIALQIEYAGGKFRGSQMQQLGIRTVQDELEKALAIFFRAGQDRAIKTTFSGRTDTGVHALAQVVHFDLPDKFLFNVYPNLRASKADAVLSSEEDCKISQSPIQESHSPETLFLPDDFQLDQDRMDKICWSLNGILPQDMSITAGQPVPSEFHARYTAIRRTYVYRILNRPQRSALRHGREYFLPAQLDLEAMKSALGCLLGRHDFRAFKSSNADRTSTICLVDRAELLNKGEAELEFWISANHFVYNMVRIIVGTLIEVGIGKRAPQALSEALAGKDRHLAGPTAPPWGLCLYSVEYPSEFNLFQREP